MPSRFLHRQLERLPAVAQLVADRHPRGRLAELRARPCHERSALRGEALCVERLPDEHHRACRVAPRGRGGEAERAQHTRGARYEDAPHPQRTRERRRVQGPGAAERHQREAARVDPALHGDRAQRAQHLRLGDPDDPLRAALGREVERGGEGGDRTLGGVAVESQTVRQLGSVPSCARLPAGFRLSLVLELVSRQRVVRRRRLVEQRAARRWRVRGQAPEQQVGVGHRRMLAAAPVARRPRVGARGVRAHAQRAARVAPRDRAAARAHRVDVEHRQRQRPARHDPLGCLRHAAVRDQAHVAGGATHVEAQHVALPRQLRQRQRPAHPAGGAGERRPRGVRGSPLRVGEAAGGLHDRRPGQPQRVGLLAELAQVGSEQGREGGVNLGGRGSLVLAESAHQLVESDTCTLGRRAASRSPSRRSCSGCA